MASEITVWSGVLLLGLIGLFLAATFAVAVALTRSRVGLWLLGAGVMLLAIMVCLFGMYSLRATPIRTVAQVEVHGDPIPLGTLTTEKARVAPISEVSVSTTAESSELAAKEQAGVHAPSTDSTSEPRPGAGRPAWMDAPMGHDGKIYRTIATSGPYATVAECNQKLPEALEEAVRSYSERLLGEGASRRVRLPASFIHERIVRGEWLEQAEFSFGPMYNLHERLEFDASVAQEIEQLYRASQVASRISYAAVGATLALGLIGILFSYLKLDTLTRGYYTGRLRVAAGAVILAEAAIVGLLVNGNIGF